jgi:hypothetical protein
MLFFSNFFNFSTNLKKIEQESEAILELDNGFKAYRLSKNLFIVDPFKNKIIKQLKDVFPLNSKRAIIEISKELNIKQNETTKKSDVWTCGFRDNEARWVWYNNSEPKMTVGFCEAYPKGLLEDKVFFFSARYGTTIISNIKNSSLSKVAKEINAFILEHSYVRIICSHCNNEENYTIDDLVDLDKNSNYSSNNVVCQHCNELIKLL